MTKKEKFINFVYLAAIARDLSKACAESSQIAAYAIRIPEKQIPVNPMNAAHVYVSYLDGRSKPFNWMRAGESRKGVSITEMAGQFTSTASVYP
jgi:hypothetical protein